MPLVDSSAIGIQQSAAPKAAEAVIEYPRHGDMPIWGIFITLCIISIIELYSASSREVAAAGVYGPIMRHVKFLVIGLGIVLACERIHYKHFYGVAYIFGGVSFLMMVYTLFFGQNINGALRSFSVGFMSIQPSEFLKIGAVLVVARIMACSQKPMGVKNEGIIKSAAVVLAFGGILYTQGLTNTLILMGISLAMMLIGGMEFKKFALVVLIYGVIGVGAKMAKASHRDDMRDSRMEQYNPFADKTQNEITAENRQEMYGYMAMANGGLIGVFPGNSRETARLPLAFSDYIYAIIVEDTGFVGGMFVMALYLWLLARAGAIAKRCHRTFPTLLVIGMAVMIVMQALFHMAITTGAFPVSGQPLPLISKGGTSILITCMAFGVMLSVSRTAVQNGSSKQVKQELNQLPEALRAENQSQLN